MIKYFFKKIFQIHSPSKEWTNIPREYHETDTECDLCDRKNQCELLEITHSEDTRRHFIRGIGYICPLEIEEENNDIQN